MAVVPPIQKFRSTWTYVQRAFRVAIYLVRLDGVIYASGATYTYTPQPGPLSELGTGDLGSPVAQGQFDGDGGGLVMTGGGPGSHVGSVSSPANSISSHSLQSPTEQHHGFFNHTHPLHGNLSSHLYSPTDVNAPPTPTDLPLHQRRNQPCPAPLTLPQGERYNEAAAITSPPSLKSPHSLPSPDHLTSPCCIQSPHAHQSAIFDGGYSFDNHGNEHMIHVVSSPREHHTIGQTSELPSNSYHDSFSTGPTSYYYAV